MRVKRPTPQRKLKSAKNISLDERVADKDTSRNVITGVGDRRRLARGISRKNVAVQTCTFSRAVAAQRWQRDTKISPPALHRRCDSIAYSGTRSPAAVVAGRDGGGGNRCRRGPTDSSSTNAAIPRERLLTMQLTFARHGYREFKDDVFDITVQY